MGLITQSDIIGVMQDLLDIRFEEQTRLHDLQRAVLPRERIVPSWLPDDTPREIRQIAQISRVNYLRLIVNSGSQSLFVDGFRVPGDGGESTGVKAWNDLWQINGLDKKQIGVHKAGIQYGVSYGWVLPGDVAPKMGVASPLQMTTAFTEDDDDFPAYALHKRKDHWRLIDDSFVHIIREIDSAYEVMSSYRHGASYCPVIRFTDDVDLDNGPVGHVEPHLPLNDQINFTTFGLLVAQHYGAFRQRYILGMLADSEEARMKMGASRFLLIEDSPEDVRPGEFSQTDIQPYITSRKSTVEHLSAIAQTPAHELTGQLVNLSAEALGTALDSRNRLLEVGKTCFGEGWEMFLTVAAEMGNLPSVDPSSYVWWRDVETRSLAAVADGLGKAAQMLGIPQEALWERFPKVTLQELEKWKELREAEPDPVPALPSP